MLFEKCMSITLQCLLLVLCNILISGCMSELHEVVLQVDLQLLHSIL